MTRLLLALWCLLLLSGCGDGSSTPVSGNQTRLLATSTSSTVRTDYANVVQQLYVAYFGRPADPEGLFNFETALVSAGAPTGIQDLTAAYNTNTSVQGLINSFGTSAESNTLYAGDTTAFVKAVYNNVLNRAPQPAGLAFWVNAIDSGTLTKANAALSIMAGALTNTSTQGLIDAAGVTNKITVASSFTTGIASGTQVNAYKGSAAAAAVRSMLATVINTTDVVAFQATVSSTIGTIVANTHSIGGTVSGLTDGLLILINGTDVIGVSAGATSFNFSSKVRNGGTYNASILAQPSGFTVVCALSNASGTMGDADVSNVTISCHDALAAVTTLAGSGSTGSTNGTGTAAAFYFPSSVAVDSSGAVYVADFGNNLIRKVMPSGLVTTLAGGGSPANANGTGTAAGFSGPVGVAVDTSGNVYVADSGNNLIRKITSAGVVTTLAGSGSQGNTNGNGTAASFYNPAGVAVDGSGNVYVADQGNCSIRKITPAGVVTTLAGSGSQGNANGTGTAASFFNPAGVAVDIFGNVSVADLGNNLIRRITSTGVVTTLAGSGSIGTTNGTGTAASFYYPRGVAVDTSGNTYVTDTANNLIRKITSAGVVTTFAGGAQGNTNGIGVAASFYSPFGVALDALGNIYVADLNNHLIRKISPQ